MVLKWLARQGRGMPSRDRMLAVLVTVLWGLNFPAIHLSLAQFPPYLLVAVGTNLPANPSSPAPVPAVLTGCAALHLDRRPDAALRAATGRARYGYAPQRHLAWRRETCRTAVAVLRCAR